MRFPLPVKGRRLLALPPARADGKELAALDALIPFNPEMLKTDVWNHKDLSRPAKKDAEWVKGGRDESH